MHYTFGDTIAAIATAPGVSGLAVVRVSGGRAVHVADRVFRGAVRLGTVGSHTLHHGWAVSRPQGIEVEARAGESGPGDGRLDEVVAAVFRAPRSYTREDVVEISCHGGRLPAERVLTALVDAGARLARAGEFTLRAFVNGRLDLVEAEAVADLIHAQTDRARELAVSQLAGSLSRRLADLSERLAGAIAEVEARVDFAEDVGGVEVPAQVVEAIGDVDRDLAGLLAGSAFARAVRQGVRIPIVGRPNVGKSSLFNMLVGEDRAIVTEYPGTTRDRVSESIEIRGVSVTLSDTAGMRDSSDPTEVLGIARSRESLDGASVVLWVLDGAERLHEEDRAIAKQLKGRRVITVLNKRDVEHVVHAADVAGLAEESVAEVVETSARTGHGRGRLQAAIARALGACDPGAERLDAIGNPRHVEALARARDALARAARAAHEGAPGECVALELREADGALGEVTGRTVGEDLLERIFNRFCVGK